MILVLGVSVSPARPLGMSPIAQFQCLHLDPILRV
jgi:hypothetical protein